MKKNICIVVSNLARGGTQRVVSTLSSGLSSYYNLYIILHDGKKIDYSYKGEIVDLRTPVAKPHVIKFFIFIVRIFRLRIIKNKTKPVAVISLLESSNFINLLSGRKGKTIVSVRNYKSEQGKRILGKFYNFLIKRFYKKSDLVITASMGLKADLVSNFHIEEEKIVVIYNPYNLGSINKKANEPLDNYYNAFFNGPVLITVGSLTKQKGQWHLIRAFKKIKKTIPGMKLFIMGEGNLRAYLEQLADELNIRDDVIFTGFKNNPFQYVSRSSIFVLSSLYEGFPNALVEAMACGLPVISCDCFSGPREILAPGTDYLVQSEQIEFVQYGMLVPVCSGLFYQVNEPLSKEEIMLADAVITMYNDKQLKEMFRKKSRERVKDFDCTRIVQQWVKLIDG